MARPGFHSRGKSAKTRERCSYPWLHCLCKILCRAFRAGNDRIETFDRRLIRFGKLGNILGLRIIFFDASLDHVLMRVEKLVSRPRKIFGHSEDQLAHKVGRFIAPLSMPLKIDGKLNPKAVALFRAASNRKYIR
ncbi:MAG: hypothetical protein ABSC37_19990 [Xanthobacteraceae bacterium]